VPTAAATVRVEGLQPLVRELKGPLFRDVNRELRQYATLIAKDLVPDVSAAVARSNAPQARAVAKTVRAHSDRVPVVVVGKTTPFSGRNWKRSGQDAATSKKRRGAVAHGVVYGPKGGRRDTPASENYYRIGRDDSGGPLGHALRTGGPLWDQACDVYLQFYASVMRRHGFIGQNIKALSWNGTG
jgi:hypothetical protein